MLRKLSNGWSRACVAGALALLATACAATKWRATHLRDHPLVGRIWDVAASRFVEEKALCTRLAASDYALLGEKHDNPDHHRLQARALECFARPPETAVVMEQLQPGHETIVKETAIGSLDSALRWENSGWPPFEDYRPIFSVIERLGLIPFAGGVPKKELPLIAKGEYATLLPVQTVLKLGLDKRDATLEKALSEIVARSHCGHLPQKSIPPMVRVQIARDAFLAAQLARSPRAALIAGAGHAHETIGVPRHLRKLNPEADIVVIAFTEVAAGQTVPRTTTDTQTSTGPDADFYWFTPAVSDGDPCDRFREQLEKLKNERGK